MTREELERLKTIDGRLQELKGQTGMELLAEALEDIMSAADILVNRRDHVTGDVALIPRTSISRLEVALEEARKASDISISTGAAVT